MILILDNFFDVLPDLNVDYVDLTIGNEVFPKWYLTFDDRDLIKKHTGLDLKPYLHALRRYEPGDSQPTFIHSDYKEGNYSTIAYFQDNPSDGTVFYRHKASGYDKLIPGVNDTLLNELSKIDAWEEIDFVPMKVNRCVLFDSALFHSRANRVVTEQRTIKIGFYK